MNAESAEITHEYLDALIEEAYRQLAESAEHAELDALASGMLREIAEIVPQDADTLPIETESNASTLPIEDESDLETLQYEVEPSSDPEDDNPAPTKRQRG